MRRAALIDIVRSPFGKGREGGALSSEHPVDLYAKVIKIDADYFVRLGIYDLQSNPASVEPEIDQDDIFVKRS